MINKSGIYFIINEINGKIYIGSAVNFRIRWNVHQSNLNLNVHENKLLQNAWNKYGAENFRFQVLEYVEDKTKLLEIEQNWLDWTKCYERKIGYNILKIAGSNLGYKASVETKAKISAAQKNRIPTEASLKALELGRLAKSEEIKNKISFSLRGKRHSIERRRNMSEGKWKKKNVNLISDPIMII